MTRTPDDIVRMEVHYCISSLVATLAGGYGNIPFTTENYATLGRVDHDATKAIRDLAEQAFELATPIDDWEEAAREAGFVSTADNSAATQNDIYYITTKEEAGDGQHLWTSWQEACDSEGIEPYQREVFEHWIVSDWLADKLEALGEKVDKDFAGLTVWARTTTGQGIASDWLFERIAADINAGV